MVDFIEQAVEDIRSEPDRGEYVELILGIQPSHTDNVAHALHELGVTIEDGGPFNTLLVTTTEENIDALCELEYVEDIELNSKGQVLTAGN